MDFLCPGWLAKDGCLLSRCSLSLIPSIPRHLPRHTTAHDVNTAFETRAQVALTADMTVRQLATKAEEQILERHGLALATALVLCPSRDSAIPFYDTAADYVGAEVRKTAWLFFKKHCSLLSSDAFSNIPDVEVGDFCYTCTPRVYPSKMTPGKQVSYCDRQVSSDGKQEIGHA